MNCRPFWWLYRTRLIIITHGTRTHVRFAYCCLLCTVHLLCTVRVRTYVHTYSHRGRYSTYEFSMRRRSVMSRRPRLSMFARQRAMHLLSEGNTSTHVVTLLCKEGINTTRQTVWRFEKHVRLHGCIEPLPKFGRPTKLAIGDLEAIENAMERDDETTGKELVALLQRNGFTVSKRTVYRARRKFGWTLRGTAYCQLIRAANHAKRLEWATQNLGSSFECVIWSDETTVQLETHRRFRCRKKGQKPRYKLRPKHPVKVHVWAGMSWRGPTRVCLRVLWMLIST